MESSPDFMESSQRSVSWVNIVLGAANGQTEEYPRLFPAYHLRIKKKLAKSAFSQINPQ